MAPRDLLLALVVILAWGVNFVVIKLGLALALELEDALTHGMTDRLAVVGGLDFLATLGHAHALAGVTAEPFAQLTRGHVDHLLELAADPDRGGGGAAGATSAQDMMAIQGTPLR